MKNRTKLKRLHKKQRKRDCELCGKPESAPIFDKNRMYVEAYHKTYNYVCNECFLEPEYMKMMPKITNLKEWGY